MNAEQSIGINHWSRGVLRASPSVPRTCRPVGRTPAL
jgi:hypothetical protein